MEVPQPLDSYLGLLVIGSLVDLLGCLTKTKQDLFDLCTELLAVSRRRMFVELCE